MYPLLLGFGRRNLLPPPRLLKRMTARLRSPHFLSSLNCPKIGVAAEGQHKCHCSLLSPRQLQILLAETMGLCLARFGLLGQCRPSAPHSAGGAASFHHRRTRQVKPRLLQVAQRHCRPKGKSHSRQQVCLGSTALSEVALTACSLAWWQVKAQLDEPMRSGLWVRSCGGSTGSHRLCCCCRLW